MGFTSAGLGYALFAVIAVVATVLYCKGKLGYREMTLAGMLCTSVDGLLLHAHPLMLTLDVLSTVYPAWRLLRPRIRRAG